MADQLPLLSDDERLPLMAKKPIEIFTLHARVKIAGLFGWKIHQSGQFIGYDGEIVADQAAFATICEAIARRGAIMSKALLSVTVSAEKEQRDANQLRGVAVSTFVEAMLNATLRELRNRS